MSNQMISIEGLSKRYLIGHQSIKRESYTSLRDVIGREMRAFARKASDVAHGRLIVQGDTIEEFWALRDISFDVKQGEVIGIIGPNGAGKSTLLKVLSRITEPTSGRVKIKGRVASLLEVGTGFHPELTGRENILLNGAILGMRRSDIRKHFDEIVAFAGVEKFLDTPVKRYSSGMYVRLAFAIAAHLEPDILVIDEVLAVGDSEFQKKCIGKMQDATSGGRTVLFVSHNMSAIRSLTNRCAVLAQGRVVFDGDANSAVEAYAKSWHATSKSSLVVGRGTHTAIRGARFLDELGHHQTHYIPGRPMRIELMIETDGTPGMSLEVFLVGEEKQRLGMASLYQFEGTTLPTLSGKYRLLFELEGLWIASGSYYLDVSTSVANSSWDHYVADAIAFEVISSNRKSGTWDFRQSFGYGAFALGCSQSPKFERL
jgi:lipopolysaccharide transport system ATP-binding protein